MGVGAAITSTACRLRCPECPMGIGSAQGVCCMLALGLASALSLVRPCLPARCVWRVATQGMLPGCCCVINVLVATIGIVLASTAAGHLGVPGTARDVVQVARYPPVVARGPMALALRLVHNYYYYYK